MRQTAAVVEGAFSGCTNRFVGPRPDGGCGEPQPAGLYIPYEAICRAVGGLAKYTVPGALRADFERRHNTSVDDDE